jgi:hypothetical protein
MNKSLLAIMILPLCLFLLGTTVAETAVVVKKGDWIEYNVTVVGTPTPNHNVTWARLDIVNVEGPAITIDFQTRFANGSMWLEPYTALNFSEGAIGEGCLIPTNLAVGDVYQSQLEGNITITGTQNLLVGGAQRTVLSGISDLTNQTRYSWDKATGIMVQATTTLPDCVVYTDTAATNLWLPQAYGFDWAVFLLLVGLLVVLALVGLIVWQKRTRQ